MDEWTITWGYQCGCCDGSGRVEHSDSILGVFEYVLQCDLLENTGRKIECIKMGRERYTNMGLREAKEAVEAAVEFLNAMQYGSKRW